MELYTCRNAPYDIIRTAASIPRPRGNAGHRKKSETVNLVCAFDIETTRLPDLDQSIMYIWQFQIDGIATVIGRTWEEYIDFINQVTAALGDRQLIVYVHNLYYEFQFLAGIFEFTTPDVFAVKSRRVLKATCGQIQYRCSYLLTNMSLDKYCETYNVEHAKIHGFDYGKLRYPWTDLTDQELLYCVNDVRGLVECIRAEMRVNGDTLDTIPLTVTGYLRREAKKAMRAFPQAQQILPSWEVFQLLRLAFRGGDTHANRYYTGDLITGLGYSYDRQSSYPHCQCCHKFPMGKWRLVQDPDIDRILDMQRRLHRAIIAEIEIYDYRLADRYDPFPYIPKHKLIARGPHMIEDNGRVLECDYLRLVVTDVDLDIIMAGTADSASFNVLQAWWTHYNYLPDVFVDLIRKYYTLKTELKGIPGKELDYALAKARLNSFYGMSAQNPAKRMIKFYPSKRNEENGGFELDLDQSDEEAFNETIRKRGMFLPYQWGVWTTAWARWELHQMQVAAGHDALYCDTDSVKCRHAIDFKEYNQQITKDARKRKAYAKDRKGKLRYMGVAEPDGEFVEFITLGAKKYGYRDTDGRVHTTISGVSKALGAKELQDLHNFTEGFVFQEAGGLEVVYNDADYGWLSVDGHDIYISRNICLKPSTYTLGITADYKSVLAYSHAIFNSIDQKGLHIMP